MDKYRRIEITVFRNRVLVVSPITGSVVSIPCDEPGSTREVEMDSEEGKEMLTEAVRLLEEKIDRLKTPNSRDRTLARSRDDAL